MGLLLNGSATSGGYYLFRQMQYSNTYIIDEFGREVHRWNNSSYTWWGTPYLLESGHLLLQAFPPDGVHLVELDWDGNIVWDFRLSDSDFRQHHDIEPLPSGNILVLTTEFHSKTEMVQAGRDTLGFTGTELWSEMLLEIEKNGATGGNIVWQWRMWDHLIQEFDPLRNNYGVVSSHPELFDLNWGVLGSPDWTHANGIDYNGAFDQIVICSRNFSEIWIIDHSTTTSEAAGHTGGDRGLGGDLLYRWGNPQVYQAGDASDQILDHQHDANWIESGCPGEGNIIVFNNGNLINHYSTVVELATTADANGNYARPDSGKAFMPLTPNWEWTDQPPEDTYANFLSGARRLSNGNTLITNGPDGELMEVAPSGDLVWRYIVPLRSTGVLWQGWYTYGNDVFRSYHFDTDYPAFEGRNLSPGSAIELNPITVSGAGTVPEFPTTADSSVSITAWIGSDINLSSVEVMIDTGNGFEPLEMFDDGLNSDGSPGDGQFGARIGKIDQSMTVQYYFVGVDDTAAVVYDPPNPPSSVYRVNITQASPYECGDIDGDSSSGTPTDISDLTYLVEYLFNGGPAPVDLSVADINNSGGGLPVDISDLTYLVDFLFGGGPAPNCN